jgi:hypothetical protein
VIALLLPFAVACARLPKPCASNPVRFLSINDVPTIDTLPDSNGGLARGDAQEAHRRRGPVVFVLAGDFLGPASSRATTTASR